MYSSDTGSEDGQISKRKQLCEICEHLTSERYNLHSDKSGFSLEWMSAHTYN